MPASPRVKKTRTSGGLAMPEVVAHVSAAAGLFREAAVNAAYERVELPLNTPVFDQLGVNACVSCALSGAMGMLDQAAPALAPLFHYYIARFEGGADGADAEGNLFLDNAVPTLVASGMCRRDLHPMPFTEAGASSAPSDDARVDAVSRVQDKPTGRLRFEEAGAAASSSWIREKLRDGFPVVLGISLPEGYDECSRRPEFEWLDPEAPAPSSLRHCVLVTGFNDLRHAIHIRDSRGRHSFGDGHWWMDYRVVDSPVVLQMYSLGP